MARINSDDLGELESWLKMRSEPQRCLIGSRAALRTFANLVVVSDEHFENLVGPAIWAVLVSAAYGNGQLYGMDAKAAHIAAHRAARHVPLPCPELSARSAAHAARAAGVRFARSAVFSGRHATAASARYSASSNAASTYATAFSKAVSRDARLLLSGKSLGPVWGNTPVPKAIAENHKRFVDVLSTDPRLAFFHEWYLGMWEGTWSDWALSYAVARIGASFWKDGLSAVAAEIERIKERLGINPPRPDSVPELERTKLLEHVKRLLAEPDMTALAAEGAAETIEAAIARFLADAPANCLPDEMSHLQDLPLLFREISSLVKQGERGKTQLNAMADKIEALNAKVADLEAKLKDARSRTVNGLFTQSAIKAAGTAFGAGLVGSLGLAVSHFFGQWPGDLTLENLRGWLSDLEQATPRPEDQGRLPPATDV